MYSLDKYCNQLWCDLRSWQYDRFFAQFHDRPWEPNGHGHPAQPLPGTTTRPRIPTTPSLRATPAASSRECRTIPRSWRGMGRKRPLGRVLDAVELGSWATCFFGPSCTSCFGGWWWMCWSFVAREESLKNSKSKLDMDVGSFCWVRSRSLKYWCCNGDISDIYI